MLVYLLRVIGSQGLNRSGSLSQIFALFTFFHLVLENVSVIALFKHFAPLITKLLLIDFGIGHDSDILFLNLHRHRVIQPAHDLSLLVLLLPLLDHLLAEVLLLAHYVQAFRLLLLFIVGKLIVSSTLFPGVLCFHNFLRLLLPRMALQVLTFTVLHGQQVSLLGVKRLL